MACLVAAAPMCVSRQRASYTSLEYEEDAATPDVFFDMICKYQSQRLDEQRASLPLRTSHTPRSVVPVTSYKKLGRRSVAGDVVQSAALTTYEQRCEMPSAPHLVSRINGRGSQQHDDDVESDDVSSEEEEEEEGEEGEDPLEAEERRDHFHDLIVQPQNQPNHVPPPPAAAAASGHKRSIMPSEDFFNLIQHLQSTRIEDQRSPLPVLAN